MRNALDAHRAAEGGISMDNYAASKLITAMGMFIHDLWALKGDIEGPHTEEEYYKLADSVVRGVTLDIKLTPPKEDV